MPGVVDVDQPLRHGITAAAKLQLLSLGKMALGGDMGEKMRDVGERRLIVTHDTQERDAGGVTGSSTLLQCRGSHGLKSGS